MIIGKTRSNIGAQIEDQYEILSQMVNDIAGHYDENALVYKKDIDKILLVSYKNELQRISTKKCIRAGP